MKAVVQTGTHGASSVAISEVEESPFFPTSVEIKTKKVPLLPYDIMKLYGEIEVGIPNILGYGAVGVVTKVGALRSKSLLGKRVIVLNPGGTFREKIISSMPPLTITVPDGVNDAEAAVVVGGADTAYMLMKKILHFKMKKVIILGANSVVGTILMQLLKIEYSDIKIIPKVRKESQAYFEKLVEKLEMASFISAEEMTEDTLVVDIAGNRDLVTYYSGRSFQIISVAIQDMVGPMFVSEPIFPKEYSLIFDMIAQKTLRVFVNQDFSVNKISEAINYQKNSHSRGRNVISFE